MNGETTLTKSDATLLREVHHALVGDPLDVAKPGLVAMVGRHEETLYGKDGRNGLRGEAIKVRKIFWMGGGAVIVLQGLVMVFEVYREFNK